MLMKTDSGMEIVAEYKLNGGYIMIDAGGRLVDDTLNSNYTIVADCLKTDFAEAMRHLNFDCKLYNERYAS